MQIKIFSASMPLNNTYTKSLMAELEQQVNEWLKGLGEGLTQIQTNTATYLDEMVIVMTVSHEPRGVWKE